jgi:hypothetical protein
MSTDRRYVESRKFRDDKALLTRLNSGTMAMLLRAVKDYGLPNAR